MEQINVMLYISDTINGLNKFTQENTQVEEEKNRVLSDASTIASDIV
jgi:methyl-accepting chemotaxis protein/methyl-accepting chemotaxis protein-2 (aspartate sensor receptor)